MAVQSIDLLNRNKLADDYLKGKLQNFFTYDPFEDTKKRINHLHKRTYPREELITNLRAMNEAWDAPQATLAEIERLGDEKSVVVIGGQQAGLLSGPLYTIHKIISIIKYARDQEIQLGVPVIPVFWIAGEDHDYDEINHVFTMTDERLNKIIIKQESWEKKSISHISIDKSLTKGWVKQIFKDLAETEYTRDLTKEIFNHVEKSQTFVDFFARFIFQLFKDTGIVLIDAADDGIRHLESEMFTQLIKKQPEMTEAIYHTSEKINQAGYAVQVDVTEEDGNLFYRDDHDERILLMRENERWIGKQDEVSFTTEELLDIAKQEPNRLSNNVMSRPIMQEALFPTLAFVAGDGEISYWALLKDAFPIFDKQMKMPPIIPRLSISLVTERIDKIMKGRLLNPAYVVNHGCDKLQFNWLASQQNPPIQLLFEKVEANMNSIHEPLQKLASSLGPDLEAESKQNLVKITKEINYLKNRMMNQIEKKYEQEIKQFEEVQSALHPNNGLQERVLNIVAFLNEYGSGFIKEIIEMELSFRLNHHIIYLNKL